MHCISICSRNHAGGNSAAPSSKTALVARVQTVPSPRQAIQLDRGEGPKKAKRIKDNFFEGNNGAGLVGNVVSYCTVLF